MNSGVFHSPNYETGHLEPGKPCPVCERRIPHPKKPTSPKTKTFSVRIPIDDVDTFNEIVEACSEHFGLKERPHHKYATLLMALALALQTPAQDLSE